MTNEDILRVKGLGFLRDKRTEDCFNARVITRNGKITADEVITIAEASKRFGNGEVAMTSRLTMEIQCVPFDNIEPLCAFLNERGLETGGTGPKVRPVVSCKGTSCVFGLIDTFGLSEKIHYDFYKGYHNVKLPHKFKIAVGGCPNNCVKPDLNDIGIVGQCVPVYDTEKCKGCKKCAVVSACPVNAVKLTDGKAEYSLTDCNNCGRCKGKCPFGAFSGYTQGYKVFIGGRWGKRVARGIPLTKIFTSEEEVLTVIESSILFFKEYGLAGERFNDTIVRMGFDEAEKIILSGELIKRKDEILAK
ncbi:MAG: (4Fe-4S)-binding protein [Clostridia bacterium]|nr:(4Fe-4S)-binding protein [Clostridia bacterium]